MKLKVGFRALGERVRAQTHSAEQGVESRAVWEDRAAGGANLRGARWNKQNGLRPGMSWVCTLPGGRREQRGRELVSHRQALVTRESLELILLCQHVGKASWQELRPAGSTANCCRQQLKISTSPSVHWEGNKQAEGRGSLVEQTLLLGNFTSMLNRKQI